MVRLLVGRIDVEADSKDGDGRTPFSWAVIMDEKTVVQLLIERDDVNADSKDNSYRTPLSHARREGS